MIVTGKLQVEEKEWKQAAELCRKDIAEWEGGREAGVQGRSSPSVPDSTSGFLPLSQAQLVPQTVPRMPPCPHALSSPVRDPIMVGRISGKSWDGLFYSGFVFDSLPTFLGMLQFLQKVLNLWHLLSGCTWIRDGIAARIFPEHNSSNLLCKLRGFPNTNYYFLLYLSKFFFSKKLYLVNMKLLLLQSRY